jgi:hypothetical protein
MSCEELLTKLRAEIKVISTSIASLLYASKIIEYENGKLKVGVYYKFHKDKLEEEKSRRLIEEATEKILNNKYRLECVVLEASQKAESKDVKNNNLVALAEEIF